MKSRCYNPKNKGFKNYGGRGIKVYDPWLNNLNLYIEYIMTLPGWDNPELSLDRIKNDENYQPGNLRFVNHHIQKTNSRIYSNNNTGYTGVTRAKDKFRASIQIFDELLWLGTYGSPQEAVMVRNEFILKNNLPEYKIQKI
jgi:hypothetical protein